MDFNDFMQRIDSDPDQGVEYAPINHAVAIAFMLVMGIVGGFLAFGLGGLLTW